MNPDGHARAIVVGASGGIGRALTAELRRRGFTGDTLSRSSIDPRLAIDIASETSIAAAAASLSATAPYQLIIVATGILHDEAIRPEKAFRDLSGDALMKYFAVNAAGPALIAKHFLPLLNAQHRSVFAALSARVGSIGDNRLGGWYGYRASKAALNMIIRTLAVELARTRPNSICVSLHPGTVDTQLSKPFQKRVPADRLFAPERAAAHLLDVLAELTPAQSGRCFAWDGTEVAP